MRWMLLAMALVACGQSGGSRMDFDSGLVDGTIDRFQSMERPPCNILDAAFARREPVPDAGACGIGGCGSGDWYCCPTTNRCCSPCDPFCCPPPDAFFTPIDAPMPD